MLGSGVVIVPAALALFALGAIVVHSAIDHLGSWLPSLGSSPFALARSLASSSTTILGHIGRALWISGKVIKGPTVVALLWGAILEGTILANSSLWSRRSA